MRYAQGGGLTPREQRARERIRLEAGARFARGERTAVVAAGLRVGVRQVEKWRRGWREGGLDALRSAGPMSVERLSPVQWERLVRELGVHRRGAVLQARRPAASALPAASVAWPQGRAARLHLGRLPGPGRGGP
ncbi:helix-turn-helix domain-containing protein [Saccharothrix sp. BKS2]|uniref:helix-turn-helix domain-containing protein n=1 Tax=Saccharothrix sp. BKS2 TaxID=3064400 RepID=UPI0039EBC702